MNTSAILGYKFKNIGAFGDDGAEVSLTTNSRDPKKELYREIEGHNVNIVTAVMGANASGKTTFLKPVPFLAWFFSEIPSSLNEDILLPNNLATFSPTEVEITFIVNSTIYRYDLKIFDNIILNESLHYKNENNIFAYIFKRAIKVDSFGKYADFLNLDKDGEIDGSSQEDVLRQIEYDYVEKHNLFTLGKKEGLRTPCNTSIIASARRLGDEVAGSISNFFGRGTFNISAWGRLPVSYGRLENKLATLYKNKELFESVKNTICQWDLGLSDIEIQEHKTKNEHNQDEVTYRFFGIHKHKDNEFTLPLYMESAGTQGAISRLVEIFLALKNGTYAFIDELGDDLHPNMIKPLIDLFTNKHTNPKGSQLVFSCHKPDLINYLGKQRVYICQKEDNTSECYRIDEFPSQDARSDENLAAKYLSGAFGGVPEL